MSVTPDRCASTGKVKHTRKGALQHARWWRSHRFARMNRYRCRSCGMWHVGNDHHPKRRRRR